MIVPITLKAARRFVDEHHRHNGAPVGWKFGAGLELGGELVGVGIVGRPTGRGLDDGFTVEVTRVCVDRASKNACSMLYGALCRASAALGFRRVVTYTLAREEGSSVRAAGVVHDADLGARGSMKYSGQGRYASDLFGVATRLEDPKTRWVRLVGPRLRTVEVAG